MDREIQDKVESFAQELALLVRKAAVEAVTGALGATETRPRRGRPPGRKAASRAAPVGRPRRGAAPGRRRKRGRRSAEQLGVISDRLYKYVKSNPGQSIEQIGKGLQLPTSELKRPASSLLEAKKLRTTGQRRGTKYHAR
ncbi:MAG TPA: hypothetical protein VMS76_12390 [Planctomycetota bacterium]|nr:hypothetical protein [Planctomycetota bacterium]